MTQTPRARLPERLSDASIALALALGALFSFRRLGESDTGWHLALGRLMARGTFPRTNALTWTSPARPWYPTSWLHDLITFEAMRAAGPLGVQLWTLVLVVGALGATAVACREIDRRWAGPAVLVAALFVSIQASPRPLQATRCVLMIVVALGTLARRRGWKLRALAVPVIVLGGNLHSGAVLAAGALGLFCLEAMLREKRVLRETALAAAGVVALVVNPGGLANLAYLVQNLHANSAMRVSEMQPPTWPADAPFFALLALTIVAVLFARRHVAVVATALVLALLTFRASRFSGEFALVAAPLLTAGAASLASRARELAAWMLLGASASAGLFYFATWAPRASLGASWDEVQLPVRAVRFIRAAHLSGHGFNAYRDGGYMEWKLPNLPAFVDARLQAYPPEFFQRELAAERSPATFQAYLRGLGVEWALTSATGHTFTGQRLLDAPDWALVYWDQTSELFVRRDVPRFASLIAANEYRLFTRRLPPDEAIFRRIADASDATLAAYQSELDRFDRWSPNDRFSRIARCAIAVRRGLGESEPACAHHDLP